MAGQKMKSGVRSVFGYISLLIVFCLLLMPAGCGGSKNNADDDYSFMEQYEEDQTGDAPAPAPAERTSIRFLFPGYKPKNWDNVKAEIEKRTRKILNVELDFQWKEHYSYISEIKTLQASNQEFDAFILAGPDGSSPDFSTLARDGVLKDITEIFPQSAPSLYKMYDHEDLKYASVDGRLYAVPSPFILAESPSIIVNDEMLEKYKIDDITDFEQYEAFLGKIKENEPDAIPGIDTTTFIASLPSAFGYAVADERSMLVYKWDDPEMKLTAWERTPEFYNVVKMYISWYEKGYLKPVMNAQDYFKAQSVLVGSYLAPPSKSTEKISLSNNIGTSIETDLVRVMRLFPDKMIQRKNPMGKFGTSGSFAFPKESGNTELVLRFLEWVQLDRENYNLVLYGIEGADHVIKNGMPEMPDGMQAYSSSYMYWGGHWAFMNTAYEIAPKKVQEHIDYVKSHSAYPPHGVFYPDYGTLDQVADKRAKGLQDFYVRLYQGNIKSEELLEKFINDMDSYGTDELIDMVQSQLTGN
jgi:putative aldouronate transport system substrate-binding protein